MKKIISLCMLGSLFVIVSCNSSGNNSFDLSKARADIEKEVSRFSEAFKKGDSVTLGAFYREDALLMPPNSESVNKAGVVAAWGSFIRMGLQELKISVQDVSGNNDLLIETGAYELYGDQSSLVDKGKYVVVWKNKNGEWKIFRDIFNTDLPAAQ